MHPFHWSIVILFAYGIHGLFKQYLEPLSPTVKPAKGAAAPRSGFAALPAFDRKFVFGLFLIVGLSLLGWLIYATNHDKLAAYITQVGFGDPNVASQLASFSIKEVGWLVFFLILTVGLLVAIFTGAFAGTRARTGSVLLGALLVLDLSRANLPWIIYQNWVNKYASNPVLDFLKDKSYEHRVTLFPVDRFVSLEGANKEVQQLGQLFGELSGVYQMEWAQHQFQFYNIKWSGPSTSFNSTISRLSPTCSARAKLRILSPTNAGRLRRRRFAIGN
jgi:hypothetical protein